MTADRRSALVPVTVDDGYEESRSFAGLFKAALGRAGLPEFVADLLADADLGLGRGELHVTSSHVERLIGRKPTGVDSVLATSPRA